ncbi:MAG: hypothetical protein B7C55_01620 [Actinomycetales bacterium mxb001]|nr:MAG: hypothetical protein B7C55_01620 [Actinomycetales bacterium mxb001]
MTEAELRDIGGVAASARIIRMVLGVGAAFFVITGVLLLLIPDTFASWIGFDSNDVVAWCLRMLGAALLGLGGQMWLVRRAGNHPVLGAAAVMIVAGGLMTILTVTLPGEWTLVRWALLIVGLAFILVYAVLLVLARRT